MGEDQLPKGIRVRQSSIAIRFNWNGRRCEETWKISPTPANIKRAARMRQEVLASIRAGVFRLEDFFPDSRNVVKNVRHELERIPAFSEISDQYLKSLVVSRSTRSGYIKSINRYFLPKLGIVPVDQIRYSHLVDLLADINWKSQKTRNNSLTPLRGIFEFAVNDGWIKFNPAEKLKFAKVQKVEPDPLTLEEVNLVLSWLNRKCEDSTCNFFEFAFFSGLRTSELLALTWNDIDFISGKVKVSRARVEGELKGTKTYVARSVELNTRSTNALQRQKSLTFLDGGVVFANLSGAAYLTNKSLRQAWNRCLKSLGLRHRVSYQTRHTFATLNLIAGANVMWVSKQMGHSNAHMTLTRYSRWVEMSDQLSETSKIDSFVSENGGNKGEVGGSILLPTV